jgi:hypothetical protein
MSAEIYAKLQALIDSLPESSPLRKYYEEIVERNRAIDAAEADANNSSNTTNTSV